MKKNPFVLLGILVITLFLLSIGLVGAYTAKVSHKSGDSSFFPFGASVVGAQVAGAGMADISAGYFLVTPFPQSTNPRYADVEFDVFNSGGDSLATQWQLVVLEPRYSTSTNSLIDVMTFIGSAGTLSSGQSESVTQRIDLQSPELHNGSKYYLMLIVDTDPSGNDTDDSNNIFVDSDFNNMFGSYAFTSVNVTSVVGFKIQASSSQQISLPTVNVDNVIINYYENPSNPLVGDYDINFKVNTSETADVCVVLEVLDASGKVNYKDDGCANSVVFTLDPSQLNDMDFPADADSNSDDNVRLSLFDSQTNDLLYEAFFDISQYIQVSGYLDVIDHYLDIDSKTGEWVFSFVVDNSYPSGYPTDLRLRIVTNYLSGSTNMVEVNEEFSNYSTLNKGNNKIEFRIPAFLDEVNYTAYVEGLGVVVAHDQWQNDYPSVNLPPLQQQPTGQVSYDINFVLDSGPFNIINNQNIPDETALNYLSVPAFSSMWNFTSATESCLLANVGDYVTYYIKSISEDPSTGIITITTKKVPSSYPFSEGYAVIAVPENKSCPIQGTLVEDFITQNLPAINPQLGWRAELVRPEWNGVSLDSIQGLCPQGSSFADARVVEQGQMLTLNGGYAFDFSATPEVDFKPLLIKCG